MNYDLLGGFDGAEGYRHFSMSDFRRVCFVAFCFPRPQTSHPPPTPLFVKLLLGVKSKLCGDLWRCHETYLSSFSCHFGAISASQRKCRRSKNALREAYYSQVSFLFYFLPSFLPSIHSPFVFFSSSCLSPFLFVSLLGNVSLKFRGAGDH